VFIGEILANMTQMSDVAPGPLVLNSDISRDIRLQIHAYHLHGANVFKTIIGKKKNYTILSQMLLTL
jgi:hypothetical protein